ADPGHSLLPPGERARLLALALLEPREVLEHVLGVLFHAATSRVGAEAEVLPDGKLVERPPPFGHVRDAGACGSVGPARKLRAVEEDVPGPAHGAGDGTQRRRLAGAVRAEDGDELALADLEGDPVQRLHRPVTRLDAVELQERAHASAPRYASITCLLPRTSAGVPSAILRPKSRTCTRSATLMTSPMWCSTSSTVSS